MQILNDFQTSVSKALSEIEPKWRDFPGLIICGTHAPHDVDFMLEQIREARENKRPFLGICFGHQLAWIEYCRNVLGIYDATSEEFGVQGHADYPKGYMGIKVNKTPKGMPTMLAPTFVVKKLSKLRVGLLPVYYRDSIPENITVSGAGELTTIQKRMESHWHEYAINPDFIEKMQGIFDLRFGDDPDIVEYMDLIEHPHFVGVQFHPEYQSSKSNPHPLLVKFIELCKK